MSLEKVRIAHSPLTDSLYIYRHGKDAGIALEKKDCEAMLFAALVEHMMFNARKGSHKVVSFGEKQYKITVIPLEGKTP